MGVLFFKKPADIPLHSGECRHWGGGRGRKGLYKDMSPLWTGRERNGGLGLFGGPFGDGVRTVALSIKSTGELNLPVGGGLWGGGGWLVVCDLSETFPDRSSIII